MSLKHSEPQTNLQGWDTRCLFCNSSKGNSVSIPTQERPLPHLKSCQPPNSRSHRQQRSKEPSTAPENLQSGGRLPHTVSHTPAPHPLHALLRCGVPRHKRRARVGGGQVTSWSLYSTYTCESCKVFRSNCNHLPVCILTQNNHRNPKL